MIQFHRQIDDLTKRIYGFSYGNGTKKKSFDSVERLKYESEMAELEEKRLAIQEREKELLNRENDLHQQEQIIQNWEWELNQREIKMMRFLESSIGKKAMDEYNSKEQKTELTQLRRGKHLGKIPRSNSQTNVTEQFDNL